MSKQAMRFSVARRFSAAADAACDGYDIKNPESIRPQIRAEYSAQNRCVYNETFNRGGLATLVEKGMKAFEEEAGFSLPWNLAASGAPWWGLPYYNFELHSGVQSWAENFEGDGGFYVRDNVQKFLKRMGEQSPVEYAARFSGWLKIAGGLYGLTRAIGATTSGRGMNSPYTKVNLFDVFDRFPSPQAAERKIWAVRKRADQILRPYGLSVSWEGLGIAMAGGSRATGKAAFRAAAHTINIVVFGYNKWNEESWGFSGRAIEVLMKARGLKKYLASDEKMQEYCIKLVRYGAAESLTDAIYQITECDGFFEKDLAMQSWLMEYVGSGECSSLYEAQKNEPFLEVDETDGVSVLYDPFFNKQIHNVSVKYGYVLGSEGKMFVLEQKHTGRTYHERVWYKGTARDAVKAALGAWRRQAELERANADLVGFLNGENGFMPLVRFVDSRNSGNCASGTHSYMEQRGWSGREWIPGFWLVQFLDHNLVKNAAMQVYRELGK